MKIDKNIILLPLILVLVSVIIEDYSALLSSGLKITSLMIIAVVALLYQKGNIYIYVILGLITYLFFLIIYNKIPLFQGIEDAIRYLIPFFALLYSLQLRPQKNKVIFLLLTFVLLNDLYQIFFFLIHPILDSSFNYEIYRATGLVGFFDFFGFINLMAIVIIREFEIKELNFFKSKKGFVYFFFLFMIWSLSLKVFIIGVIYLIVRNWRVLISLLIFTPLIFLYRVELYTGVQLRIDRYILNVKSARLESYKFLVDNFREFFVIGKGPGVFGGPASTKYNSEFYQLYGFNWHNEQAMSTVDAYYPHLFVELGIIIGILYLLFILVAPFVTTKRSIISLIVILILLINSIFTFSLNSVDYCFFSLILVYLGNHYYINLHEIFNRRKFPSFKKLL